MITTQHPIKYFKTVSSMFSSQSCYCIIMEMFYIILKSFVMFNFWLLLIILKYPSCCFEKSNLCHNLTWGGGVVKYYLVFTITSDIIIC